MREVALKLDGESVKIEKQETVWSVSLEPSQMAGLDERALLYLRRQHPAFLPLEFEKVGEQVVFSFQLSQAVTPFEEWKGKLASEKLRLALNLLDLSSVTDLNLTTTLQPENLAIQADGTVRLAYRALSEVMLPRQFSRDDFLYEWKCLVVSLFSEHDFTKLYDGGLQVLELKDFLEEVRTLATLDEARELVATYLEKKRKQEAEELVLVKGRNFRLYKILSIWLGALCLILALPLIYLLFWGQPQKEQLLKADAAYLKADYSGVISTMEKTSLSQIPQTQKVLLATSYIKGLSFSDQQREVILNNVSFKSDPLYLDYWIQVGRGRFEEALDIAKRLNDSDLIIYALVEEMKEVRKNDQLSGKEREEKMASLESDYKKYWDQRKTDLTEEPKESSASAVPEGQTPASSTSASQ